MSSFSGFPRRSILAVAVATAMSLTFLPGAPQSSAEDTGITSVESADGESGVPGAAAPSFDSRAEWQEALEEAETAVVDAEAELHDATDDVEAQKEKVDAAKTTLESAEAERDRAQAELDELDISQREEDVQNAEEALARAETKFSDAERAREDARGADAAASAELKKATEERDKQQKLVDDSDKAVKDLAGAQREYEDAIAEVHHREETGADYTQDDWKRLASQSVEEMINQYRQAQGLHRLVTHRSYNQQAELWSKTMVKDYDATRSDSSFRHSDFDEWGHSGENIIYVFVDDWQSDPATWDRSSWHNVPLKLFDGWRNSPGHNSNMLSAKSQGMGVGIDIAHDGRIYATTMFFIHDTQETNGLRWQPDGMTRYAQSTGAPFFVPSGAIETMRAKPLSNPGYSAGYRPSYAGVVRNGLDKTLGKTSGLDRRINRIDYSAALEKLEAKKKYIDAISAYIKEQLPGRRQKLQELNGKVSRATERSTDAQTELTNAQSQVDRAASELAEAREQLSEANADLQRAKDTPRAPYEEALASATDAVEAATRALDEERSRLSTLSASVKQARSRLDRAESHLSEVRAAEPNRPSPSGGNSGGSSTAGTVIGVIVAILAAIGLASTVAPQLGIDLSQFGF